MCTHETLTVFFFAMRQITGSVHSPEFLNILQCSSAKAGQACPITCRDDSCVSLQDRIGTSPRYAVDDWGFPETSSHFMLSVSLCPCRGAPMYTAHRFKATFKRKYSGDRPSARPGLQDVIHCTLASSSVGILAFELPLAPPHSKSPAPDSRLTMS